MTREEREDAIDIIQLTLDKYEEDECLVTEITIGDEDIKAFKMAIEVLEQEPILDKIRKIVDEWQSDSWTDNLSYECMIKIAELVEPQESEASDG